MIARGRTAIIACCLLWAAPAAAEEPDVCVAAMADAQAAREDRQLLRARAALQTCARDACPEIVHRKCREWLPEVVTLLPSLVVTAFDHEGKAVNIERVLVDGEPIGRHDQAIDIDPGPHRISIHVGQETLERAVVASEAEQTAIRFDLPAPPQPDPAPTSTPSPEADNDAIAVPVIMWTGFGIAGAGAVVGTVLGIMSAVRADELTEQCNSEAGCPQSAIDDAVAVADASTGALVVGAVGATIGVAAMILSLASDDVALSPYDGAVIRF